MIYLFFLYTITFLCLICADQHDFPSVALHIFLFQISYINQFININRYQICLDPTISLAVLYSGLFTRNNRISNATFPNRFNPSVKCFNFELIIHNPCHNSTISRIKYRYQRPLSYCERSEQLRP